ncbi:mCG16976, isoform CRA_a [Mus musculus]|nr:mCG16976, isoform CRA_a [Mus musculus]
MAPVSARACAGLGCYSRKTRSLRSPPGGFIWTLLIQ